MDAIWAWARSELRRRRRANLALSALIALSGAVALTTAAGARRTESAFDRFIEDSDTASVQVQYGTDEDIDDEVLAAFQDHPDVVTAAPIQFTIAFSDVTEYDLLVLSGPDPAEFRDVDRPRLLDGRRPDPSSAEEVLFTPFLRDIVHAEVGDTVSLGTFTAEQFDNESFSEPPAGPVLDLEVVGIGTLPYDAADEAFGAALATPAFYETYATQAGGFGPSIEVLTRPGVDAEAVAEEIMSQFEVEEVFFTPVSDLSASTEDGTSVLVAGLWVFTAVAALAFVVASSQAIRRRIEATDADQPTLRAVGLDGPERTLAMMLTVAPVILAGAALAALLAIPVSATMPIGSARRAEPNPGIAIDATALLIGAALLAVVLLVSSAWAAWRVSAQRTRPETGGSAWISRTAPARALRSTLRPPAHLGLTMALDPTSQRGTVPVRSAFIGAAFGAAGLVAVLTFGASLDALVEEPARTGWNWSLSLDLVDDKQLDDVRTIRGVQDIGRIIQRQVLADGEPTPGAAVASEQGSPSLTVVRGRIPGADGEAAIGPELGSREDLGIGDTITLTGPEGEEVPKVIVGEVLFPTFDDDSTFNDGVALTPTALAAVARSDGSEAVIVRFEDEVSDAEAAKRVTAVLPDALSVYSYPTLPTDVANLNGVRSLPRALGLFIGLLGLAAIGHAVATSVQRRRREFGTVRSFGFLAREVRRAVGAQATSLGIGGLVIGVPLGLVIGRTAWRIVATGMGVAGSPTVPLAALVVLVPATVAAALLVAWYPGRTAGRGVALDALRAE
jgi:ABC-type lipoprotein release transport system permease subunit